MASVYEPARRQELLDRLSRLAPDRPPRWGRLTAPKMVLHLLESLRMATGELRTRPRTLPIPLFVRRLVIHHLPWHKGAPTAPELLARVPTTWEGDLAALRAAIAALPEPADGAPLPDHPAFGPMRKQDWGVLVYRHVDHHLKQFGC